MVGLVIQFLLFGKRYSSSQVLGAAIVTVGDSTRAGLFHRNPLACFAAAVADVANAVLRLSLYRYSSVRCCRCYAVIAASVADV